jgi:serine/threonine-protein kinase
MDQLGDYLVRRLLGEGGMGKVYEGEERLSKRRVALKVLHSELGRSPEGRRLFVNEMQILAQLEHPNIVRSLSSLEANGEMVMVLEYLDGRTLRAALSQTGRFPWQDTIRIVADVASALSAAHGREPPVIHRDLKPENIMLCHDGVVKVMDFGIAKVIQAMNQTNTQSAGTLQYMSPEQIDAHTIDHRSDLYCLGLIFYELIAGKAPFVSASPRQLLNMQCSQEPPALPDDVRVGMPRGVEQLIFQLLEKAPEDRPYLAEDVVQRLEPFQTAIAPRTSVSARSAGPGSPRASNSGAQRTPPRTSTTPIGSPSPRLSPAPVDAPAAAPVDRAEPAAPAPAPVQRADTIALVERVNQGREVPTKIAVGVIVALSMVAGLGAYLLRSTSAPLKEEASPTAAIPTIATTAPKRGPR